jgi:eukaryotic-like serine/threonine-protein kinase
LLYGRALGRSIANEGDFETVIAPTPSPQSDVHPSEVLDRFEAWMPEQIAVMKLRGFVDGVGGQIADSEPGIIRVRLPDSRAKPAPKSSGILALLGFGRPKPEAPPQWTLHLVMEKKQVGVRSLVEIAVVLPRNQGLGDESTRRRFGERICRELRAYLMIGR